MRWRTLLFVITTAVGVFLVTGDTAQAGLITASAENAIPWISGQTASLPVESAQSAEAPSRPVPRNPFVVAHNGQQFAHAGSSGTMSSQSSDGPTSNSGVAALPVGPDANAILVAWLGAEGRVWIRPGFSLGVFRPPRCVG